MRPLDIEDLRNDPDRLDRVVQKSSDVDRFCSSSAWALSALEAFHPESTPRICHQRRCLGARKDRQVSLIRWRFDSVGGGLKGGQLP